MTAGGIRIKMTSAEAKVQRDEKVPRPNSQIQVVFNILLQRVALERAA